MNNVIFVGQGVPKNTTKVYNKVNHKKKPKKTLILCLNK